MIRSRANQRSSSRMASAEDVKDNAAERRKEALMKASTRYREAEPYLNEVDLFYRTERDRLLCELSLMKLPSLFYRQRALPLIISIRLLEKYNKWFKGIAMVGEEAEKQLKSMEKKS